MWHQVSRVGKIRCYLNKLMNPQFRLNKCSPRVSHCNYPPRGQRGISSDAPLIRFIHLERMNERLTRAARTIEAAIDPAMRRKDFDQARATLVACMKGTRRTNRRTSS